jgi:hypothetical protein
MINAAREQTCEEKLESARRDIERLGSEYRLLRAENQDLRIALQQIKYRYEQNDDRGFSLGGRVGGVAWAMYQDAESALTEEEE